MYNMFFQNFSKILVKSQPLIILWKFHTIDYLGVTQPTAPPLEISKTPLSPTPLSVSLSLYEKPFSALSQPIPIPKCQNNLQIRSTHLNSFIFLQITLHFLTFHIKFLQILHLSGYLIN